MRLDPATVASSVMHLLAASPPANQLRRLA